MTLSFKLVLIKECQPSIPLCPSWKLKTFKWCLKSLIKEISKSVKSFNTCGCIPISKLLAIAKGGITFFLCIWFWQIWQTTNFPLFFLLGIKILFGDNKHFWISGQVFSLYKYNNLKYHLANFFEAEDEEFQHF